MAGRRGFAAPCPGCPQGTPLRSSWQVVGRRAVFSIVSGSYPSPPLWIPAFAGMTNGGPEWRMRGCRSGLSRIVVWDMLSYQWRIEGPAFAPKVTYFGQCGVSCPLCAVYGSRSH